MPDARALQRGELFARPRKIAGEQRRRQDNIFFAHMRSLSPIGIILYIVSYAASGRSADVQNKRHDC